MRWLVKLTRRIRLLVDRRGVEREMDEEFRSHLEEEIQALELSGLAPGAARRAARLAFGGGEQVKEEARDARGGRLLDDFRADLRYAGRQLVRSPGYTASVVSVLGVAIAATCVALTLARVYLIRPIAVPHPDRLVSVIAGPSRAALPNPPDLRGVDWASAGRFLPETVAWDLDGFTLVGGGPAPESVEGSWVSPGFFTALGIVPALGRSFAPAEYVPGSTVMLISDRLWRRRFGADPNIVGKAVRAHSTDRPTEEAMVTVVGVLAPLRWEVHRFVDVLRPLGTPRFFSMAVLPDGMSIDDAAARLTTAVRAQVATDSSWRMSLVSAQEESVVAIEPVIHAVVAAAILLLLLAEASVGALVVTRGTTRAHELAVRRALGASHPRMVRQLLVEAGVVVGMALLVGYALTPLSDGLLARTIERFGRVPIPGGVESVRLDPGIALVVAVAATVPLVAFGLIPMLGLVRAAPIGSGTRTSASPSAVRARRMLVTVQVAVAVGLVGPGLMLAKSIREMLGADLGFEAESLIKGHFLLPRTLYPDSASRVAAVDRILAEVERVDGVVSASVIDHPPFRGVNIDRLECEGCAVARGEPILADAQVVDAGYWETMKIPLVRGRRFDQRDGFGGAPVAVVSERLVERLWPGSDGLGQRLRMTGPDEPSPWRTVIGVTAEVRKTYSDSLYPDLYLNNAQVGRWYLALVVRTRGNPIASIGPIRAAVAREHEALALAELEPMTDLLATRRGRTGVLASLVGGVAGLAFVVTGFGLYAVVGYLVRLRRREFAIRSAMGARPATLVAAVIGDASGMLLAGVALGLLTTLGSTGLVRSFLVGVTPADPSTYFGLSVAVLVLAIAALAPSAHRAASADPVEVLREDQ